MITGITKKKEIKVSQQVRTRQLFQRIVSKKNAVAAAAVVVDNNNKSIYKLVVVVAVAVVPVIVSPPSPLCPRYLRALTQAQSRRPASSRGPAPGRHLCSLCLCSPLLLRPRSHSAPCPRRRRAGAGRGAAALRPEQVHAVVRAVGAGGELEPLVTGPTHRYHPLIHDDCALCLQRRTALNQADPLPAPLPCAAR